MEVVRGQMRVTQAVHDSVEEVLVEVGGAHDGDDVQDGLNVRIELLTGKSHHRTVARSKK